MTERGQSVTVKLAKLSICRCGYSVLRDNIGIDAEYRIYPATLRGGFKYFCGGCQLLLTDVTVIDADQGAGMPPMPLPAGLFELKFELKL